MQSSNANNPVTTAAKEAYQSLNACVHRNASIIIRIKQITSEKRTNVAHPTISQQYLDKFLNDIGPGSLDLSHLEHRLFYYLRTTSTTPANIQGAKWSLSPILRSKHHPTFSRAAIIPTFSSWLYKLLHTRYILVFFIDLLRKFSLFYISWLFLWTNQ